MEPYEELINAIILQAATDYRNALERMKEFPKDRDARHTKRECEEFFRSTWFLDISDADGDLIIKKIKTEVNRLWKSQQENF